MSKKIKTIILVGIIGLLIGTGYNKPIAVEEEILNVEPIQEVEDISEFDKHIQLIGDNENVAVAGFPEDTVLFFLDSNNKPIWGFNGTVNLYDYDSFINEDGSVNKEGSFISSYDFEDGFILFKNLQKAKYDEVNGTSTPAKRYAIEIDGYYFKQYQNQFKYAYFSAKDTLLLKPTKYLKEEDINESLVREGAANLDSGNVKPGLLGASCTGGHTFKIDNPGCLETNITYDYCYDVRVSPTSIDPKFETICKPQTTIDFGSSLTITNGNFNYTNERWKNAKISSYSNYYSLSRTSGDYCDGTTTVHLESAKVTFEKEGLGTFSETTYMHTGSITSTNEADGSLSHQTAAGCNVKLAAECAKYFKPVSLDGSSSASISKTVTLTGDRTFKLKCERCEGKVTLSAKTNYGSVSVKPVVTANGTDYSCTFTATTSGGSCSVDIPSGYDYTVSWPGRTYHSIGSTSGTNGSALACSGSGSSSAVYNRLTRSVCTSGAWNKDTISFSTDGLSSGGETITGNDCVTVYQGYSINNVKSPNNYDFYATHDSGDIDESGDNETISVSHERINRTLSVCSMDDYYSTDTQVTNKMNISWSGNDTRLGGNGEYSVNGSATTTNTIGSNHKKCTDYTIWSGSTITYDEPSLYANSKDNASNDVKYHDISILGTSNLGQIEANASINIKNQHKTRYVNVYAEDDYGSTKQNITSNCGDSSPAYNEWNGSSNETLELTGNATEGGSKSIKAYQGIAACKIEATTPTYYDAPVVNLDATKMVTKDEQAQNPTFGTSVDKIYVHNHRINTNMVIHSYIDTDQWEERNNTYTIELEDKSYLLNKWLSDDATSQFENGLITRTIVPTLSTETQTVKIPSMAKWKLTNLNSESISKYYNTSMIPNFNDFLANQEYNIYNRRKTDVLTFHVKNDNGYAVTNTVKLTAKDVETDNVLSSTLTYSSDGTTGNSTTWTNGISSKSITVQPNSSVDLTFTVPRGTHLFIEATNNAGKSGYKNLDDYITLVETTEEYKKSDYLRKNYNEELGREYVVFDSLEDDELEALELKKENSEKNAMVIDNQYQRVSIGYNQTDSSINNNTKKTIVYKLYECFTDSCTTNYKVGETKLNDSTKMFYTTVTYEDEYTNEDGVLESKLVDQHVGDISHTFTGLEKYSKYKIVQETYVPDRYYSWDSGYEIIATDFAGKGKGTTTCDSYGCSGSQACSIADGTCFVQEFDGEDDPNYLLLNHNSKVVKTLMVEGVETDLAPVEAGNVIVTGTGGSSIVTNMKQPITKVTVKVATESGLAVADVQMSFGATTQGKSPEKNNRANRNIITYDAARRAGITFSSESGTALQPDIDYVGFLGGTPTSNSRESVTSPVGWWLYDELNGKADSYQPSWNHEELLTMAHYEAFDGTDIVAPTMNIVLNTAKVTIKAKADKGYLNGMFKVYIDDPAYPVQYSFGNEMENGEMRANYTLVTMHLGDEEMPACSTIGDSTNTVCLETEGKYAGYYSFTTEVPVSGIWNIDTAFEDFNRNLYYDVEQSVDGVTYKNKGIEIVGMFKPENSGEEHIEVFDFTRQNSTITTTAKQIEGVKYDRDIINLNTISLKDSQNEGDVCSVELYGNYCAAWDPTYDWSSWENYEDKYSSKEFKVVNKDNAINGEDANVYTFELNPTYSSSDSITFDVPAGMGYEIDANVDRTNDGFSIATLISNWFGHKDNHGYETLSTYIEQGARGLTKTKDITFITEVTNDYKYARYNISNNGKSLIAIYNKDGEPVKNSDDSLFTLDFADYTEYPADLEYELSPYTFKIVPDADGLYAPGYYITPDVTLASEKDGTYDIDLTQEEIKLDLSVRGLEGDKLVPITNITYAIGTDAEHIVYTGVIDKDNIIIGKEAGLQVDTDYQIFFGYELDPETGAVTDYVGEVMPVHIEHTVPEKMPAIQNKVAMHEVTVSATGLYPTFQDKAGATITFTNDGQPKYWNYDGVVNGVYDIQATSDGEGTKIWLADELVYTVKANDVFGYMKEAKVDGTDSLEEVAINSSVAVSYTPKHYNVKVTAKNAIFGDSIKDLTVVVRSSDEDPEASVHAIMDGIERDTNADGEVEFVLEYGPVYYIRVSGNAYGYEDDTKVKHFIDLPVEPATADDEMFIFNEDSNEDIAASTREVDLLKNPLTYDFDLTVKNSYYDEKIKNASYGLYDITLGKDLSEYEKANFTITKDDDGTIHFVNVPYSEKHDVGFKQNADLFGYKTDENAHSVELPDSWLFNKLLTRETSLEPYSYTIEVDLSNEQFEDVRVSDAVYSIKDKTTGEEIAKITTDGEGKASYDLVYGHDFQVSLVEAPYGYKLDETAKDITLPLTYDFENPESVLVNNLTIEPYTFDVKVSAYNDGFEGTSTSVDGVGYAIYDLDICSSVEVPMKPVDRQCSGSGDALEACTRANELMRQMYEEELARYEEELARVCTPIAVEKTENGEVSFQDLVFGHNYYYVQINTPYGYHANNVKHSIITHEGRPTNVETEIMLNIEGFKEQGIDFVEKKEILAETAITPYIFNITIDNVNAAWEKPEVAVDKIIYKVIDDTTGEELGEYPANELGIVEISLVYGHEYHYIQSNEVFGYQKDEKEYKVSDLMSQIKDFEKDSIKVTNKIEPKEFIIALNVSNVKFEEIGVEGIEYVVYYADTEEVAKKVVVNGREEIKLPYGRDYYIVQSEKETFGYNRDTERYDFKMEELEAMKHEFAGKPAFEKDIKIEPYNYKVRLSVDNGVFTDVPVIGAKYAIYDYDDYTDTPIEEPVIREVVREDLACKEEDTECLARQAEIDAIYEAELELANEEFLEAHSKWEAQPYTRTYALIEILEIGEEGFVEADLTYGHNYFIVEVEAPFGYIKDEQSHDIVLPDTFDFASGNAFEISLHNEPKTYSVEINKVDELGNPVEGVEYTVFDSDRGENVIAEDGCLTPVQVTDKDGKVVFVLIYGHKYNIKETNIPTGFTEDNLDDIIVNPTSEDEFKFIEDAEEDEDINIKLETENAVGKEVNILVTSNHNTTFDLIVNGVTIESKYGNNITFVTSYSQNAKYNIYARAIGGYSGHGMKESVVTLNDEEEPIATSVSFNFSANYHPETRPIRVRVGNLVAGTQVFVWDDSENCVAKGTAKSTAVMEFDLPYKQYHVTVNWPAEYYRNPNKHWVDLGSADFATGVGITDIIKPVRYLIKGYTPTTPEKKVDDVEKTIFGLTIRTEKAGREVNNVIYSVFYKGTEDIAKDLEGNKLENIDGKTPMFLSNKKEYEVRQIEVPARFVIAEPIEVIPVTLFEKAEDVISFTTITFNNEYTDELARRLDAHATKCSEDYEALRRAFAAYDQSKYSEKNWAIIVQLYEQAVAKLDTTCSLTDEELVDKFEINEAVTVDFSSISLGFTTAADEVAQKVDWYHWVILGALVLTFLLNLIIHGGGINIIFSVVDIIASIVIFLLFDRCKLALIFTGVALLLGIIMAIIRVIEARTYGEVDDER